MWKRIGISLAVLISSSILVLAAALAYGYYYLLPNYLKQVGIEQLEWSLDSIGWHHLDLKRLAFHYQQSTWQTPVQVNNLRIRWQWPQQGWQPQLQVVEIDALRLALATHAAPGTSSEAQAFNSRWPSDWRLPDLLPQQLSIAEIQLHLPCQATSAFNDESCQYQARLNFSRQAQQQAQLQAQVNIVANDRMMDAVPQPALTMALHYQVRNTLPTVAIDIELPQQFSLDVKQDLGKHDADNYQLNGTAQLRLFAPQTWLVEHLQRWQLQLPNSLNAWLSTTDKAIHGDAEWHLQLPQQSVQEAVNHAKPPSWQSLSGELQARVNSASPISISEQLASTVEAQLQVSLLAGRLHHYAVTANGHIASANIAPTWHQQLRQAQLDIDGVDWQLQSEQQQLDFRRWPVNLQFSTQGASQISLQGDTELVLAQPLWQPGQWHLPSLASIQLQGQRLQLAWQQPSWQWQDWQLSNLAWQSLLAIELSPTHWQLRSLAPASAHAKIHSSSVVSPLLSLSIPSLTISGGDFAKPEVEQLQAQVFADIKQLQLTALDEQLATLNWSWQGTIDGTVKTQRLHLNGNLSNSAGLSLNHQATLDPQQLQLDWQLDKLYWLAGNAIAKWWRKWPPALVLQRGNAAAQGQLSLPWQAPQQWQLAANINLDDVDAVYDTSELKQLQGDLELHLDAQQFQLQSANLKAASLSQGVTSGALLLAMDYQGQWQTPLQGQLTLHQNQLAIFGGELSVPNQVYDLAQPITVRLQIKRWQLGQILQQYPAAEMQANGEISGYLPIQIGASGVSIAQGEVSAIPPGGVLQLQSSKAKQLAQSNQGVKVVVEALEDFHYSVLTSQIRYQDDGTLILGLDLQGYNPQLEDGRPVQLRITIEEDLPALITGLQLTNSVSELIQKRVQERVMQLRKQ